MLMNELIKSILKLIGAYILYAVLTIIVFYITGLYIWTTPPTKLVLIRMLVFPFILTLATYLFIWIVKKAKNNKNGEFMKKEQQIILCTVLLIIGLLSFIFQVFVFSSPNGILGFLLCLVSIYLIFGSIIKLCKLSEKFKNNILDILDLLFFIR